MALVMALNKGGRRDGDYTDNSPKPDKTTLHYCGKFIYLSGKKIKQTNANPER